MVWDRFQAEAEADLEKAQERYVKALEEHERDLAKWCEEESARNAEEESTVDAPKRKGKKPARKLIPLPPNVPRARLQDGDVVNFLRLATALKIFLGPSINDQGIARAEELFREYLTNLDEVCRVLLICCICACSRQNPFSCTDPMASSLITIGRSTSPTSYATSGPFMGSGRS